MSNVRLIRCKTPSDIIVVKSKADYDNIAQSLAEVKTCDHGHLIVCGDVWFSTPKAEQLKVLREVTRSA